ncbi:MAG: lamin tail domain-containing protein, partial [Verrucomicrobiota bacterium]|nr:lamin tail domain-containing protein [Verrucomicrobiota bacterium]
SFSLNKGNNLLAIQGLNDLKGSSDMLLSTSLASNKGQDGDTIYINIPDQIKSPVWVKSRSFNSRTGEWSALNSAFFTTGKPANDQNIVISEVHYHPSAPTESELEINPDFDQDDFEFIEVMNVSGQAIDLGGCAFVLIPVKNRLEGVEFKFEPTTIIRANQRLVIAANRLAFETRYPGIEIAGDYSNRLDNSGEWITLIDKDGTIIDSFRYNDKSPWPELADGEGPSLYLPDPSKLPDTSNAENWSASMTGGGNPTSADAMNFFGDPTADADEDGTIAIMEYALGLSDFISSYDQFPKVKIINIRGQNYLNFNFRKNPKTTSISYHIETSTDMKSWEDSDNDGGVHFEGESLDSDGTPIHTFRLKNPITNENSMRYLRLKINY